MVKKAIIFIPGIGGSNLYCSTDDPGTLKQIYLTKGFLVNGGGSRLFAYDDWEERDYELFRDVSNQLYAQEMIRAKDINIAQEINTVFSPISPIVFSHLYIQKGYDKIMHFFKTKDWLIRRAKNDWKLPEDVSEDKNEFYEFPYDWRRDITEIANDILSLIESHWNDLFDREIYLIGHSTGGLISRCFLKNNTYDNIKGQILIGTPNHGAPKAYWILRAGKGFLFYKFPILNKIPPNLKELCYNLPLPYQLLPSKHYENFFMNGPAYGPIVTVKGNEVTKIEPTYYASQANQSAIPNMTPQKAWDWYSLKNDSLVQSALSFHADLGQDTYLPNKTYVIYSSEVKTLAGVDFRKKPGEDGDPRLPKIGDGTVPAASAYDLNGIGKAKSDDLSIVEFSKDFKDIEHTDLPINEKVLEYISKIIKI
jgi:hypothetical protein